MAALPASLPAAAIKRAFRRRGSCSSGEHHAAARLGLLLLAPGVVFWWGFALPFGPVFGLASTILTLANWRFFVHA